MKTEMSDRQFCKRCGGHLMTDHPPLGLVDVYAATIPTLKFSPGRARQLCRDGAADEGRAAQAEGFSRRTRRLRRPVPEYRADAVGDHRDALINTNPVDGEIHGNSNIPDDARRRSRSATATDAKAALLTLRAKARPTMPRVTCKVETGRGLALAGIHPKCGGSGLELCSGDMLLEALIACAGVSMRAAAAVLDIPVKSAVVSAEGDVDLRGTLGVAEDVPVGFKEIRLRFDVETDASASPARSARRAHRPLLRDLPDHPEPARRPAFRSSRQDTEPDRGDRLRPSSRSQRAKSLIRRQPDQARTLMVTRSCR